MSKRITRELLQTQELKQQKIFYFFKDDNFRKGNAYIFGPENTPYEHIPLEFSFTLPDDYPFVPPIVNYNTNDGLTRFHPNFYIDGKVCLSILGTYSGPKWVSSLNISAVLLSLHSLMTKNPLQHEPGYESLNESHPKCSQYSDYVEHNMIKLFFNMYPIYKKVEDEMFQTVLEESKNKLIEKVSKKAEYHDILFTILPYGMSGRTHWKELAKQ